MSRTILLYEGSINDDTGASDTKVTKSVATDSCPSSETAILAFVKLGTGRYRCGFLGRNKGERMTPDGWKTVLPGRNARHFLVADEFLLRAPKTRQGVMAEEARYERGERSWIVFCFVQRVGGHHDDRIEHKRGAPGGVTGHKIPRRPLLRWRRDVGASPVSHIKRATAWSALLGPSSSTVDSRSSLPLESVPFAGRTDSIEPSFLDFQLDESNPLFPRRRRKAFCIRDRWKTKRSNIARFPSSTCHFPSETLATLYPVRSSSRALVKGSPA